MRYPLLRASYRRLSIFRPPTLWALFSAQFHDYEEAIPITTTPIHEFPSDLESAVDPSPSDTTLAVTADQPPLHSTNYC